MKKTITAVLACATMASVSNAAPVASDDACDAACQNNVRAVFATGKLAYALHFDKTAPARVSLMINTSDRSDFAPVEYVGSVAAGLHSARLSKIHFPDPKEDPCSGLISVTDRVGDTVQTYFVPVRNVKCAD
ncbi:hypothetical protein [Paraburkholderia sp. SIMBA_054]|uniref:hypothetical protein n=1 Tax=Paraburkholderia sp. SIMBA_054 TaxID=3085795 RepID=UPI00397D3DBE